MVVLSNNEDSRTYFIIQFVTPLNGPVTILGCLFLAHVVLYSMPQHPRTSLVYILNIQFQPRHPPALPASVTVFSDIRTNTEAVIGVAFVRQVKPLGKVASYEVILEPS